VQARGKVTRGDSANELNPLEKTTLSKDHRRVDSERGSERGSGSQQQHTAPAFEWPLQATGSGRKRWFAKTGSGRAFAKIGSGQKRWFTKTGSGQARDGSSTRLRHLNGRYKCQSGRGSARGWAPEGAKPGASEPVISPCCYPAPPLPSSGKTTTPPPPLLLLPLSRAALTLTSRQLDRPRQSCLSKLDHRLHASQQRDRTLWVAVAGWISGGL
jgi:hypothetical protein